MDEQEHADWLELSARFVNGELGGQGDCDTCGHWSGHLIDDMCAPCREKYEPEVK